MSIIDDFVCGVYENLCDSPSSWIETKVWSKDPELISSHRVLSKEVGEYKDGEPKLIQLNVDWLSWGVSPTFHTPNAPKLNKEQKKKLKRAALYWYKWKKGEEKKVIDKRYGVDHDVLLEFIDNLEKEREELYNE